MEKIIKWFKESNRWKHFIFGILIGLFSYGWYCAAYAGIGVASALELKDKLWGGKWDWIDWAMTMAGGLIGQAVQAGILYFIFK